MEETLDSALRVLLGEQLGAVTFIHDYWQLAFDGPMLTVFSRISLNGPAGTVSDGHPDFRNQLCDCIGHLVEAANFKEGECIRILFDTGVAVEASLRDSDYRGPEAGTYDKGVPGAALYVY
jgi:hypothetical protein